MHKTQAMVMLFSGAIQCCRARLQMEDKIRFLPQIKLKIHVHLYGFEIPKPWFFADM
jgi:hypothetical protein